MSEVSVGPARVPSNISSQYLTSLLIIGPLIEGGLTIEVEGELTSKPYVDLTLDEMAKFGANVENHGYQKLIVAPLSYRAGAIDVEGEQHRPGPSLCSAAHPWNGRDTVAITAEAPLHNSQLYGRRH